MILLSCSILLGLLYDRRDGRATTTSFTAPEIANSFHDCPDLPDSECFILLIERPICKDIG